MIALVILLIVGGGFIIAATFTDPSALTDDGFSLQWFFYAMGSWFIGLPILLVIFSSLRQRRNRLFTQNGIQAIAKIISAMATGTQINNMPMFKFELEITLPGRTPYVIKHRCVVNLAQLNRVTIGAQLPIVADPNNPKKILIRWDA